MTDSLNDEIAAECTTIEVAEGSRKRPYEAPSCEKKRSVHRVTLLSGMGVLSMGALSMTN